MMTMISLFFRRAEKYDKAITFYKEVTRIQPVGYSPSEVLYECFVDCRFYTHMPGVKQNGTEVHYVSKTSGDSKALDQLVGCP